MQNTNQKVNLPSLRIIWGALLFSHILYGFALFKVIGQHTTPESINPVYIPALSSFGAALFMLAIFLPRFVINVQKKALKAKSGLGEMEKTNFEDMIQGFATPFILRLALFESVVLCGFVLAFLHKNMELFYPFAALSAVAFIKNFPTEEMIKETFK